MTKEEFKIPVVGYLVVKHCGGGIKKPFVTLEPMEFNCWSDAGIDVAPNVDLDEKCEIIGIVPAVPGSYAIYTFDDEKEDPDELDRYEIGGVTHP